MVLPPSVATNAAEDNQEGDEDPPNDHLGNGSRSPRTTESTFAVDAGTRLAARSIRAVLAIAQVVARVREVARVRLIIVIVGV